MSRRTSDAALLAELRYLPADIAAGVVARRGDPARGGLAAIRRLVAAMAHRGDPWDEPSAAAFLAAGPRDAPATRRQVRALVEALRVAAPEIGTAAARPLMRSVQPRRRTAPPGERVDIVIPEVVGWPPEWMVLRPGLLAAPIKPSSIRKHVLALNRLARLLPMIKGPQAPSSLLAIQLRRALERDGKRPATVAGDLASLAALGHHGGMDRRGLRGLHVMQFVQAQSAREGGRLRDERLDAVAEKGGLGWIVGRIVGLLDEADAAGDWSAEAELCRATAAIAMLAVQRPARTGDVGLWRYGDELVRRPTGVWELFWQIEKTGPWIDAGRLWPETGAILDIHLRGGRPRRHAQALYDARRGRGWLHAEGLAASRSWPSQQIARRFEGLALHDLRTLVSDLLRGHDPSTAARIVRALLGHLDPRSGEAYAHDCEGDAAQEIWMAVRREIARGGGG